MRSLNPSILFYLHPQQLLFAFFHSTLSSLETTFTYSSWGLSSKSYQQFNLNPHFILLLYYMVIHFLSNNYSYSCSYSPSLTFNCYFVLHLSQPLNSYSALYVNYQSLNEYWLASLYQLISTPTPLYANPKRFKVQFWDF